MKKIILLMIPILLLCGCEETKNYNIDNYNNREYDIFIDETTCVEYFINTYVKKGGISVRYNADGTLKINKDCLEKGR